MYGDIKLDGKLVNLWIYKKLERCNVAMHARWEWDSVCLFSIAILFSWPASRTYSMFIRDGNFSPWKSHALLQRKAEQRYSRLFFHFYLLRIFLLYLSRCSYAADVTRASTSRFSMEVGGRRDSFSVWPPCTPSASINRRPVGERVNNSFALAKIFGNVCPRSHRAVGFC